MPSLPAGTRRAAGFTLVEILIIAPIVLLIVSGFIALMVSMVGDVMQTRDHSALTYDVQYSLDRIEQDTHLSTRFLSTTGAQTAPQGSDSNFTGSAAFTSGNNVLIFNQPATDADPNTPSRRLLYYAMQPNPCGPTESFNRIFTQKVVYFVKDGSLWRRSLVPSWNTNGTPDANTICDDYSVLGRPWARNSCSPGQTAVRCETQDEEIMKNVDSFTTKYYSTPGGSGDLGAANAENAVAIEVTINASKTTAGHPYSTSSSLRASKINSLDTDVRAIETPVVSHSFPRPDKVTFSWSAVLGAVTYNTWYNINGGAWQYLSVSSGTTSRTIDANRGDTVSFRVSAVATTGTSQEGVDAATMDLWTNLSLTGGWVQYSDTSYSSPQFTKSPDGTVIVKGLIRSGNTANDSIIAQLPEGYRPAGRLLFATSTNDYTNGRVDIDKDGYIRVYGASNGYLALDGINFLPASSPYAWRSTTFSNGWVNYDTTADPAWEQVHSAIDGLGRVHVQGLAKNGTTLNNTVIGQPSSTTGMIPALPMHFPTGSNISYWTDMWVWSGAGQYVKRGSAAATYMAPTAFFYPGSAGSWSGPSSWSGGWGNYNTASYPALQCAKASDKIVTVRGVVGGGSTTRNSVIATLPANCRPVERQIFTVVSYNDAYGRVDLDTDGTLRFVEGSSTWLATNFSFITN